MDENKAIEIIQKNIESQFPKTCPNCGMVFDSLAEYHRNTTFLGDPISYDADIDDWKPEKPIGTVALANCRCGTTLGVSSLDLDLWTYWRILIWSRIETWRQGISMSELMAHIRDEIDRRVLRGD